MNNYTSAFDKENSKFVVTVYHERQWQQGYNYTNATTHYMKFVKESAEYDKDPHKIELGRIVRIIEKKVTGKFSENKIKTILVYVNQNKGNKNTGTNNPEFSKMVIQNHQINNFTVNHNEQFWIDFMTSIANQIQEKLQIHAV